MAKQPRLKTRTYHRSKRWPRLPASACRLQCTARAFCFRAVKRNLINRIVQRFRGGLVFKADRLYYHSTLGSTVIKKKRRIEVSAGDVGLACFRVPLAPSVLYPGVRLLFFFLIALKPGGYNSLRALNTSPSRNRFTLVRSCDS